MLHNGQDTREGAERSGVSGERLRLSKSRAPGCAAVALIVLAFLVVLGLARADGKGATGVDGFGSELEVMVGWLGAMQPYMQEGLGLDLGADVQMQIESTAAKRVSLVLLAQQGSDEYA